MANLERINPSEKLKTSFPKINAAIDAAGRSETKSEQAVRTANQASDYANQANQKADITQTQIDQVTQANTIDPAVEQMKVDTEGVSHASADARLRSDFNKLSSGLTDITYNVKSFGAKGDGETDDTQAIKDALSALKATGGRLIFPKGVYIQGDGVINARPTSYSQSGTYNDGTGEYPNFVPSDGVAYPYFIKEGKNVPYGDQNIGEVLRFWVDGMKNAEIIGHGAVIRSHRNNSTIIRNGGFVFLGCENVKISGITYDGNIREREPFLNDAGGYNFQHGFAVSDDCKDITFEDVSANGCAMDGFNIHRRVENVRLINCFGFENYRQGVTVGNSRKITIEGGEYSRTGTIFGTAPMAGIDVEVWEDTEADNLYFKKITFRGNIGRGLYLHSGTQNSTVEECLFDHNELAEDARNTKNNTIRNNTFINTGFIGRGGGTYVDDNKFFYDGSFSGTYRPAIISDDSSNKFLAGESRRGRIKGNFIYCNLTNVSENVTVLGVIAGINSTTTDVEDNVMINAFSKTGTGVINGTPRTFANNKITYTGPLTNSGRVNGGIHNYGNEVSSSYSKVDAYPYDLENTPALLSDRNDTGIKTTQHSRGLIASEQSRSSGKDSVVIGSSNSRVSAPKSAIISSGVDSTVYPIENEGSNSLILSSRAVKNTEPYVVVGGYRAASSPGTAQTSDRKWRLSSQTGDIDHSGVIRSGHAFSDFAELFPNLTGRPQGNGILQTLDGYGVRPASAGDRILGVTSATAGIILGDTPFSWQARWLTDDFGAYLYEEVKDEETGKTILSQVENPDYDPEKEHISRIERPEEWSVVGLVGQVYVRVNADVSAMDYIKPYKEGIGGFSEHQTNIQVMKISAPFKKEKGYAVAYCIIS